MEQGGRRNARLMSRPVEVEGGRLPASDGNDEQGRKMAVGRWPVTATRRDRGAGR